MSTVKQSVLSLRREIREGYLFVQTSYMYVIFQEHLMQRDRLLQNKIHQAFRRSEHQLLKALEARKAEVKVRITLDLTRF